MSWRSTLNAQSKHVELVIEGAISRDELMAACDRTCELALEQDTPLVLADCSMMRGGHNILDLYQLAKQLIEKPHAREMREAIIAAQDPEAREMLRFWETTCLNRGLLVQLFEDREQAIDWLHSRAGALHT